VRAREETLTPSMIAPPESRPTPWRARRAVDRPPAAGGDDTWASDGHGPRLGSLHIAAAESWENCCRGNSWDKAETRRRYRSS
jgi:hypothetical protein